MSDLTIMPVVSGQTVQLTAIRIDGGTQTRAELHYDTVQEYTQSMVEGAEFPPVTVFYDGSEYWMADGFHRYFAAKQLCRETIEADVKPGTRRDAVLYSVGANATHGLPRTNKDKRCAVEILLSDEEWSGWSDHEIARQCAVSAMTVGRIKKELICNNVIDAPSERLVHRNGITYTMNTANIGQQQNLTDEDKRDQQSEPEVRQQNLTREEFLDEVFPGFTEWQRNRVEETLPPVETPKPEEGERSAHPSVDDETLANFTRWQQDNLTLGLDAFADPLPATQEDESLAEIAEKKEKRDTHVMRVMGSSESPEWYTPKEIIDLVCQMFVEIDTDPCSNSHETPVVPARTLYTKEDNGLLQTWKGKTYLNPPYGAEISQWTDKLIFDYKQGHIEEALALLPARIDTVWFSPLYEYLMCNVRGRLQFANSPYSAPFPCVVVYLGERRDEFIRVFKNLGPIMERIAG